MDSQIAQAATNNGASDAADFQPPTQNPQTAPGQLFPETGSVQPGSQESLLQNRNAEILVPTNPAPLNNPQVAEAKSGSGVVVAVVLAAIILTLLQLWRKRQTVTPAPPATVEPIPDRVIETSLQTPEQVATPKKTTKKPAPKKSKSQRKKRARR